MTLKLLFSTQTSESVAYRIRSATNMTSRVETRQRRVKLYKEYMRGIVILRVVLRRLSMTFGEDL